jgi:hypothetical protein
MNQSLGSNVVVGMERTGTSVIRFVGPVAVALLCLSFMGGSWAAPASGSFVAVTHHRHGLRVVIKQVQTPLGNCPFATVDLRVQIARSTYTSAQPVDILAVARNEGKVTCQYVGTGRGAQYIGPCGAFGLNVLNESGTSIWPGPIAWSCPAMGATYLAPGAQVMASGSWPKQAVTTAGTAPAPNGTYRLVIGSSLEFGGAVTSKAISLTIHLK